MVTIAKHTERATAHEVIPDLSLDEAIARARRGLEEGADDIMIETWDNGPRVVS